MPAQTIDEVISELTEVIARARADEDRAGYFAALYRRVTIAVKEGIARGAFQDGERMARLDVAFANRYLDALAAFRKSEPASHCWLVAFGAMGHRRPIILQHLLLGMNAHINLDLAIAAAETAPGAGFLPLKHDFDCINQILASLVNRVQDDVGSLSPSLVLLDQVGGRTDEAVVNFSIDRARQDAWSFANELIGLPPEAWAQAITAQDLKTALRSEFIATPRPILTLSLLWIRVRESWNVRRIIDVLSAA
jgi:hypothetical protein